MANIPNPASARPADLPSTARTEPSRRRRTRAALRAATGVQATLVFTQAVLAGHLLTGDTGARTLHRELGTEVITWVALILVVLAVVAWRPGRGPAWPIAVALGAFVAVVLQLAFGFTGRVAVHVPLGVALLVAHLVLLVALRRPRVAGAA